MEHRNWTEEVLEDGTIMLRCGCGEMIDAAHLRQIAREAKSAGK